MLQRPTARVSCPIRGPSFLAQSFSLLPHFSNLPYLKSTYSTASLRSLILRLPNPYLSDFLLELEHTPDRLTHSRWICLFREYKSIPETENGPFVPVHNAPMTSYIPSITDSSTTDPSNSQMPAPQQLPESLLVSVDSHSLPPQTQTEAELVKEMGMGMGHSDETEKDEATDKINTPIMSIIHTPTSLTAATADSSTTVDAFLVPPSSSTAPCPTGETQVQPLTPAELDNSIETLTETEMGMELATWMRKLLWLLFWTTLLVQVTILVLSRMHVKRTRLLLHLIPSNL
ncbi:hypothetical protein VKT23_014334 [Stygiomarasmius scandens]|uniref:Uncharacterized protein n=1 Tax=Marasmiellus scandens TaxID=2682957 RepID=A0ABR1J0M5_9AGAR